MNKIRSISCLAALLFLSIQVLSVSAGQVQSKENLVALVGPPEGWSLLEPPQTAEGEQLFTIINGGAELYVRLGFTRAVFASYQSGEGKNINLEIYLMKTPSSARDAYAQKVSAKGKPAEFGEESLFEDYFLNFYRGSYQVTVSGYDSDSPTVAGLFAIAKEIDRRLGER
jgi:hypothetical protein